jgi:putative ABC transport system permease protein
MIRHLLKLVWNRKRENAIVIAEILLSFLVLFFVLIMSVTYISNWRRPLGFHYDNVLVLKTDIDYGLVGAKNPEVRGQLERLAAEARAFPEVQSVAFSSTPPYNLSTSATEKVINGKKASFVIDEVSDDFAKTMGVEVVRGRWFSAEDNSAHWSPFVIDENAARTLFGDEDPIGKKIEYVDNGAGRIVGVVKPYRKDGETMSPPNMMFRRAMYGADGELPRNMVLRVRSGATAEFEEKLLQRMQSVAPAMAFDLRSMDRMRSMQLRMVCTPVIAGGIVALFLIAMVALGLTGVMWQNVTKRTREIGLRRAMGASGPAVHRQILSEVALLATVSVAVGSAIVFQLPILGVFRLVTPAAFTAGFAGALATIYGLTLLCGLYPSWLAARLEPAEALRYE